ncbi:MAG: DUF4140 domain-containing protein [Anaerolineales bacterium]|nr:DUF4140 domain-containing protein [Anaerolineales bacterium]
MDIQLTTTVTDVTVYPDRARVVCGGECVVTVGQQRLLLDNLPLTLDADSLRVTGRGEAQVRLLSVDVVRQHFAEAPAAKVRELEQAIEQAEDELQQLADAQAGWQAQLSHLDGLRGQTAVFASIHLSMPVSVGSCGNKPPTHGQPLASYPVAANYPRRYLDQRQGLPILLT